VERALGLESVDEVAVMVDTFRPLGLGTAGRSVLAADYAWSWAARG
jgi:homogentisate 1,2-dioxygenase